MATRLNRHPILSTAIASLIALGATLGVAELVGLHQVGRAFQHLHPAWIALAVVAQAVSVPAYAGAYREVVATTTGARLRFRLLLELVIVGFGPFAISGGFDLDRRVLKRLGLDGQRALSAVLDLGGVEFLALVWLAFAAALVAVLGDPSLPGSLVWPWLIAVPVGTAIAIGLSRLPRPGGHSGRHVVLGELHGSLCEVLGLARHPLRRWATWASIIVYWLFDMVTLYATLRMFGLRPTPESLALAYATGYLLSRRTLPLGGAGFVTVLLTFSLYWMHEPLAPSLAGVAVYRGVSYVLADLPALIARRRLQAASERGDVFEPPTAEHPSTEPAAGARSSARAQRSEA